MNTIEVADLAADCLTILENLDWDEITIVRDGEPIANLTRAKKLAKGSELIGILEGLVFVDPDDDLSSYDG